MLDTVQHTIEISVEKASDGFPSPPIFHERSSGVTEHESAAKPAASSALSRFVKGCAVALAVVAGVSAGSRPVVAAETPAEFISVLGTDVLQEMNSYTISLDQKEAYFRQMLSQDADLDGISRFVLGPSWRVASPEQRQEFVNLLQDYIMRADGPKLVQYSGGTFRVTGSRTDAAGVIVTTQITSPQGQPIELDWQLGIVGGLYKIEDLTIDGVSVALTRRSQIQTMMEQAGGRVATLLVMMRQQG